MNGPLCQPTWRSVIEKAFGVSMETLMRMQNSFDIAQAHRRENDIAVERYVPKAQDAPRPSAS